MLVIIMDFMILTDTRQQKENHIIKEFDKQKILHIRTTLESADYVAVRKNENEFYIDYSILIDTKKDLEELSSNLCSKDHARVKREIERARELGCQEFYFIIANNKIKTIDDLRKWRSKRKRVTGEILCKVMKTMAERYKIKFIITKKNEVGKKIINIFKRKGEK